MEDETKLDNYIIYNCDDLEGLQDWFNLCRHAKQESNKKCMYCKTIQNKWDIYKVSCGHYYHSRCFRAEMTKQYIHNFKYHCLECKQLLLSYCSTCDSDIPISLPQKICKFCGLETSHPYDIYTRKCIFGITKEK